MMRNKPANSMQKTYDECFLTCSTAVFFENQNNEAEALRSWKTALDQINYHNAYKVPSSYVPRTETEKALSESLKQMEMQCKERVDLLEALKQSRKDANKDDSDSSGRLKKEKSRPMPGQPGGWLGDATIPPTQYSDIPNPTPPMLPSRPPTVSRLSSASVQTKPADETRNSTQSLAPPPKLPVPQKTSRSPSPEHGKKTMRRTLRPEGRAPKTRSSAVRPSRPAPMKAAGLAWDTHPRANSVTNIRPDSDPMVEARLSAAAARRSFDTPRADEGTSESFIKMPDPADYISIKNWRDASGTPRAPLDAQMERMRVSSGHSSLASPRSDLAEPGTPPPPPPHTTPFSQASPSADRIPPPLKPAQLSYRKEYLPPTSNVPPSLAHNIMEKAYQKQAEEQAPSNISRKPVARPAPPPPRRSKADNALSSDSEDKLRPRAQRPNVPVKENTDITPPSSDAESADDGASSKTKWEQRVDALLKKLPKGIDEAAAKNILNEIVVKGDEVHWDDVAGLESAKKALKEAVVYPFLRPDLFMGLREPARGMLLFGPPGTGKTMLARAVATESKSTFFAISASSLTSKWHGESEKLVRALFGLAKALAPSIIFVDEIDSLLSSRGGGSEHEASRRSKTEFLIQWSDLQRAAAGRDVSAGDASRVLVLAATNCPWDIDDAARRRFVRRQYIPLPEDETREIQLRTLLAAQKHDLSERDVQRLVALTDGYSGSDITALAKDAAMGPLRNLGEALLFTPMDQIRPIRMADFQSSIQSIRPSVSKKGLEEFEEWAREYGERGS